MCSCIRKAFCVIVGLKCLFLNCVYNFYYIIHLLRFVWLWNLCSFENWICLLHTQSALHKQNYEITYNLFKLYIIYTCLCLYNGWYWQLCFAPISLSQLVHAVDRMSKAEITPCSWQIIKIQLTLIYNLKPVSSKKKNFFKMTFCNVLINMWNMQNSWVRRGAELTWWSIHDKWGLDESKRSYKQLITCTHFASTSCTFWGTLWPKWKCN